MSSTIKHTHTAGAVKPKPPKFYAVRRGKRAGIYSTWDECKAQVMGFRGAVFKSFDTYEEANDWLLNLGQYAKKAHDNSSADGEDSDEEVAYVFTDGSFSTRTKRGAYGYYIPSIPHEYAVATIGNTNNENEIVAVRDALRYLKRYHPTKRFTFECDSEYVVKSINQYSLKWFAHPEKHTHIKYLDLFAEICPPFHLGIHKIEHVYAHTGGQDERSIGNDYIDKLVQGLSHGGH